MKHGAWTTCPACHHLPEENEDKAKHLFLTDHYHHRDELARFAEAIKSGKGVNLPEGVIEEFAKGISQSEDQWRKAGRTARRFGLVLVVVALVVIVLVIIIWGR